MAGGGTREAGIPGEDNGQVVVPVLIGARRKTRRVSGVARSEVKSVPFVSVTPNEKQLSLNRDVLAVLGYPSYVLWMSPKGRFQEDTSKTVRLMAAGRRTNHSRTLTYCTNRPQALSTVPEPFRGHLPPGRYLSVAWTKPGDIPAYVDICFETPVVKRG